jgi:hypothetical protein
MRTFAPASVRRARFAEEVCERGINEMELPSLTVLSESDISFI